MGGHSSLPRKTKTTIGGMENMKMNKKAMSLDMIPTVVVLLVVIAIVMGLGQTILTNILGTQTANTYAYNATVYGQQGINTFASFQTTIAIVVVAGVILGVIGAVLLRKYV
jgi:hypothetical protein